MNLRNCINCFVTNFTGFDEQVHHKKMLTQLPTEYFEMRFIKDESLYKDFYRLLLILSNEKNSLIKSNPKHIREVLTALFYRPEEKHGLSSETLRRISPNKNSDLQFNNELDSFKSYLRSIISNRYSRDYFLP